MAKKSRNTFFDAEKFAKSLGDLVSTLPTEPDKERVTSQLDSLIQFLTTLKSNLEHIPTQQDALAVQTAVDTLKSLFSQAKANPIVATAFGLKSSLPRQRPPAITPEEADRATKVISRFEAMPIDELRATLDGMNARDLQAVANAIGMRTNCRTPREGLLHQIATKITNARGYRSLRDGKS